MHPVSKGIKENIISFQIDSLPIEWKGLMYFDYDTRFSITVPNTKKVWE